ncbi:hypothetical protein FD881_17295 [Acinetobacter baumannii]|nr:hypothetical protein APD15_11830 [Acinetobacter baumannii]OTK98870.1 hypothetical protein B9X84_09830 [Acinetobacter baumannii]OWX10390.1 hypothetical protein A7A33_16810 [Acinetobacter baumannii]PRO11265.1 hypothetical protein B9W31_17085 [Acinetobacter baumannii]PRO23898.1 hypothetical protein B9W57_17165 [Acinetobacter baumannii]
MVITNLNSNIKEILDKKVQSTYSSLFESGFTYHINFYRENNIYKATVSFFKGQVDLCAIYELRQDKFHNEYWYMVRDWKD